MAEVKFLHLQSRLQLMATAKVLHPQSKLQLSNQTVANLSTAQPLSAALAWFILQALHHTISGQLQQAR